MKKNYEEVMAIPPMPHLKPVKQSGLLRMLVKCLSVPELHKAHFRCEVNGMEAIGKKEPCLYLMNHSSFIDLKVAFSLIGTKPFHIVCTSDGFVGKSWLMRRLGCISTKKFITDITLSLIHI